MERNATGASGDDVYLSAQQNDFESNARHFRLLHELDAETLEALESGSLFASRILKPRELKSPEFLAGPQIFQSHPRLLLQDTLKYPWVDAERWQRLRRLEQKVELVDFETNILYPAPLVFLREEKILQRVLRGDNLKEVLSLADPFEFEELVGDLLRQQGFDVLPTSNGADGGIDFVLTKFDGTIANCYYVQCKHLKTRPVDVMAVRELYGIVTVDNVNAGLLVASSRFSKKAHKFSEKIPHRIQLADYGKLEAWVDRLRRIRS